MRARKRSPAQLATATKGTKAFQEKAKVLGLSMTPDAIRLREKRRAATAAGRPYQDNSSTKGQKASLQRQIKQ